MHRRILSFVSAGLLWFSAVPTLAVDEGILAIFDDLQATRCELVVSSGQNRTLYAVFVVDGSTRGGIAGMEFQLDASEATGYLMLAAEPANPNVVTVGNAIGGGLNIAFTTCQNGVAIPILKLQVMNLGAGAANAPLMVRPHSRPSNPSFACVLANLCNHPFYTEVCVVGGRSLLNPSSDVACGTGAQKSAWSGVKELYK